MLTGKTSLSEHTKVLYSIFPIWYLKNQSRNSRRFYSSMIEAQFNFPEPKKRKCWGMRIFLNKERDSSEKLSKCGRECSFNLSYLILLFECVAEPIPSSTFSSISIPNIPVLFTPFLFNPILELPSFLCTSSSCTPPLLVHLLFLWNSCSCSTHVHEQSHLSPPQLLPAPTYTVFL